MTTITRRSGVRVSGGTGPRLAYVKNLANNPRAAANTTGLVTSWGPGGSGNASAVAKGGPLTNCPSFYRSVWTTAPTGVASTVQIRNGGPEGWNLITGGKDYVFKVYVRSNTALTLQPKIGFFNTAYLTADAGTEVTLVPNKWTLLTMATKAPASATRAQFNTDPGASSASLQSGTVIDVTGWFPHENPGADGVAEYGDGDSAGWSWLGTPHASPSQGYGAVVN